MGILGSSNIFSLLYFSFIFLSFPLGYCCCSCEMEATVAASVASAAMVVVDKRADRAEMIIDSIYEFCLRVLRLLGSACAISIHTHTISLSLYCAQSYSVQSTNIRMAYMLYPHEFIAPHLRAVAEEKEICVCSSANALVRLVTTKPIDSRTGTHSSVYAAKVAMARLHSFCSMIERFGEKLNSFTYIVNIEYCWSPCNETYTH